MKKMYALRELLNKRDTMISRVEEQISDIRLSRIAHTEDSIVEFNKNLQSRNDKLINNTLNLISINDVIAEKNAQKKIKITLFGEEHTISMLSALYMKDYLEVLLRQYKDERQIHVKLLNDIDQWQIAVKKEYQDYLTLEKKNNIDRVNRDIPEIPLLTFEKWSESKADNILTGLSLSEIDKIIEDISDAMDNLNSNMLEFNILEKEEMDLI